ncbi:MAG TPA: S1C family serine protease [Geminicoccaceae bacterium]|nr:S1C family serine protease [Geminicoccaceae bacterium]
MTAQPNATDPLADFSDRIATIVAGAAPSVVAVHGGRRPTSGFAWRPDLVVTAEEAVEADEGVDVGLPGGERVRAELVGRDPATAVALLRLPGRELPSLALADAPEPRAGELVVAVGGHDAGPIAALGVVAVTGGAWRSLRGGRIDRLLHLDLRLAGRGEGGIVLDATGQALGMAVFGPRRRVLAIPAPTVERVAAQLAVHGRVARGYLGLGLQPVRLDGSGEEAAMVMSVDPQGPGARAGLQQGDVIATWDGQPVGGVRKLLRELGPDSVGRTVELGLRRAGQPASASLTIGERPAG